MSKKSDFLVSSDPVAHELETPAGPLTVYVRPLSWIQQQEALSQFVDFDMEDGGSPSIDFGGYWRYVFTKCITRTIPDLSSDDLLNLSPEVGAVVQSVLPSIFNIVNSFAASPLD